MELYAIRYGTGPFALCSTFRDRAGSEEFTETDWLFYLAITADKAILFDVGFRDGDLAAEWNVTFTGHEAELASLLGGREVSTVVITHRHFDHIDNLDLYPGAGIVIARGAYEAALRKSPEPVRKVLRGARVRRVDDELPMEGGLLFKVIGGHDEGSSVVYFSEGGRGYVLAGDECYACANALENRPIGSCTDEARSAAFTLDAHTRGLVPLPCHVKAVFAAYPKVSENIVRIV